MYEETKKIGDCKTSALASKLRLHFCGRCVLSPVRFCRKVSCKITSVQAWSLVSKPSVSKPSPLTPYFLFNTTSARGRRECIKVDQVLKWVLGFKGLTLVDLSLFVFAPLWWSNGLHSRNKTARFTVRILLTPIFFFEGGVCHSKIVCSWALGQKSVVVEKNLCWPKWGVKIKICVILTVIVVVEPAYSKSFLIIQQSTHSKYRC